MKSWWLNLQLELLPLRHHFLQCLADLSKWWLNQCLTMDGNTMDSSFLPAMESQVGAQTDPGQSAPITPPMTSMRLPPTPRQPHDTRARGPDDDDDADHESKRARLESQKKQKINQVIEHNESMIRMVQVGDDNFATLDDYETELDMTADAPEDEFWCDEDQLQFDNVPEALWSKAPLDKPPQAPEAWIDALADAVEIDRLVKMGVLQKAEECHEEVSGTLTIRFVYDWRIKDGPDGTKQWMRRSRFVAREFATSKRHDTYSPATGSHIANLVPLVYLKMLSEVNGESDNNDYQVIMAALDIKDAFLQVPQEKLVGVSLYNQNYVIKRYLPGQRLGAKAWYRYFRNYVTEVLKCEWSVEQPCLARCTSNGVHNCFMIQVDDLLFTGDLKFWNETFLPAMKAKFNVSHSDLTENGAEISFLKRHIMKLAAEGLLVVPGTTVEKVVTYFERFFGATRAQKIPCDSAIQNDDESRLLSPGDVKSYRSVIGLLLLLRGTGLM